jgi:hypothetical protein
MNMASFIVVHSITICQPTKESESASQIKSNSLKLSPPRTKHLSYKEHHNNNNHTLGEKITNPKTKAIREGIIKNSHAKKYVHKCENLMELNFWFYLLLGMSFPLM